MDEKIVSNILKKQISQEEIYFTKYIYQLEKIYKEDNSKKKDKLRKEADKYIDELSIIKQEKENVKEMLLSIYSIKEIKEEENNNSIR
jgi:hypothetical protein